MFDALCRVLAREKYQQGQNLTHVRVSFPPQNPYYTACPSGKCNKKVTDDGNGNWRCEACQQSFDHCQRRYTLSLKAADTSGSCWINAFNDQAAQIFGMSADELHARRECNDGSFEKTVQQALWKPFVMKLKARERGRCLAFRASPAAARGLCWLRMRQLTTPAVSSSPRFYRAVEDGGVQGGGEQAHHRRLPGEVRSRPSAPHLPASHLIR